MAIQIQLKPEDTLQKQCVDYTRLVYPNLLLFAIPNGGKRSKITALILQLTGVKAGIPDLFLAKPTKKYAGLFIELKVPPNKPTDKQKEMIQKLNQEGYLASVVYSCDEYSKLLKTYLNEL